MDISPPRAAPTASRGAFLPTSTTPTRGACWHLVPAHVRLSLAPAELHSGAARRLAARRAFASLLMRFHPALGGVVVGQRGGLSFGAGPLATSTPASPFAHVSAAATLLVFAPPPGVCLTAPVAHVGPDHVGLALWDTFHVVLPLDQVGGAYKHDAGKRRWICAGSGTAPDVDVGSDVRFSVVGLKHTQAGIFHVDATLCGPDGQLSAGLGVQEKRSRTAGSASRLATARVSVGQAQNGQDGGVGRRGNNKGSDDSDKDMQHVDDGEDGGEDDFGASGLPFTPMKTSRSTPVPGLGDSNVFDDALAGDDGQLGGDNMDSKPLIDQRDGVQTPNWKSDDIVGAFPTGGAVKTESLLVAVQKDEDAEVMAHDRPAKKKSKKSSSKKRPKTGIVPGELSEYAPNQLEHQNRDEKDKKKLNSKKRKRSSAASAVSGERAVDISQGTGGPAQEANGHASGSKHGRKEKRRRRKGKAEDIVATQVFGGQAKDVKADETAHPAHASGGDADAVNPEQGNRSVRVKEEALCAPGISSEATNGDSGVKVEDVPAAVASSKRRGKLSKKKSKDNKRARNMEILGRRLSAQMRSKE